jgi:hypothetical protein
MAGNSVDWVTEHRYRAVLQVIDGVSKSQVARECGASRQSVHSWVIRYEALGLPGLADRSRRPLTSPNELPPTVVGDGLRTAPHLSTLGRSTHRPRVDTPWCGRATVAVECVPNFGRAWPGGCPAAEPQTQVPTLAARRPDAALADRHHGIPLAPP